MIVIKATDEINLMREAGKIAGGALEEGLKNTKPGMTTAALNELIEKFIRRFKAVPSFLGYGGFPASACISVNEEVIHGIPGSRVIEEGDVVSIDVGACYNGWHGDTAGTAGAGAISQEAQRLIDVTRECLKKGIQQAKAQNRIGDISNAVETCARASGFGVVKKYIGHGVGSDLHEDPEVPNFGRPGHGYRLVEGMTIAIEPMINLKGDGVIDLSDGWTVVTESRTISAHFEHTVLITANGPEILTLA